jgi:hypothetical protein
MAKGEVIGCGGNASTSAIGTSNFRMFAKLSGVQDGGGIGFLTQRSSLGPPIGLNTAWLDGKKP